MQPEDFMQISAGFTQNRFRNLSGIVPVSQRIWTPRGFGPPGPNPLADLNPPGPYPLADLDPPSQIWTPHLTFLFRNLF